MTTSFEHSQDTQDTQENFEEMLEASLTQEESLHIGQMVEGRIVHHDSESVYVDISGKSEALIPLQEFQDSEIIPGTEIQAMVVDTSRDTRLTFYLGRSPLPASLLRHAKNAALPVYGTVEKEIKGGYQVSVGGLRAFCPGSQMDIRKTGDKGYLGKEFAFLVTESSGRNTVVSRRALLEKARDESKAELKERIETGTTVTGTVSSIHRFGIFISIDGFDALVPASELSQSRSVQPDDFTIGTEVQARVIDLDWDSDKITLSIKALESNPWQETLPFSEGDTISGTVVNTIKTGAFIELAPGLEGFCHISRMSLTQRIRKPEDVVSRGQKVQVRVLSIDHDSRKVGLELITGEDNPWEGDLKALQDLPLQVTVESSSPKGLTVRLENGISGFIPQRELLAGGQDTQKAYPAGTTITAAIIDINATERRCRLSEKAAEKARDRQNYREFSKQQEEEKSSTLGAMFSDTFADLKKKIDT